MTNRMEPPESITRLLVAYGDGDDAALDRLLPQVYDRLHALAHRHMLGERRHHTFTTTALVHEAYLALVNQAVVTSKNRLQFFALASRMMRNILIDYARQRHAQKRGGDAIRTSLDDTTIALEERAEELLALDEALTRLAEFDERLAQVVEYRFFGGMTIAETAEVLQVSAMTVTRDWQKAKAWLYHVMHTS